MILKHVENANKGQPTEPPALQPKDPEAMEELDELLRKAAHKASLELKELYQDIVFSEEGLDGSATTM